MRTITLEEFRTEIKAQGVRTERMCLICPMCGMVQNATDFIAAGAGKSMDEVEKYLGFSCIGRFTGAPAPRQKPDGKPCNWTLGGLFKLHKLEVRTPDGQLHPRFEIAAREQAEAHIKTQMEKENVHANC